MQKISITSKLYSEDDRKEGIPTFLTQKNKTVEKLSTKAAQGSLELLQTALTNSKGIDGLPSKITFEDFQDSSSSSTKTLSNRLFPSPKEWKPDTSLLACRLGGMGAPPLPKEGGLPYLMGVARTVNGSAQFLIDTLVKILDSACLKTEIPGWNFFPSENPPPALIQKSLEKLGTWIASKEPAYLKEFAIYLSEEHSLPLAQTQQFVADLLGIGTMVVTPFILKGIKTGVNKTLSMTKVAAPLTSEISSLTNSRFCYAKEYGQFNCAFLEAPLEFDGILSKDLTLVRLGTAVDNQEMTCIWFSTPSHFNKIATMEGLLDSAAIIPEFGTKTHLTLARIPAGEHVKFLHGKAAPQTSPSTKRFHHGGLVQYQFKNFNPTWLKASREIPGTVPRSEMADYFKNIPIVGHSNLSAETIAQAHTLNKFATLEKPWKNETLLIPRSERIARDIIENEIGFTKHLTPQELAKVTLVVKDGLLYHSGNLNLPLHDLTIPYSIVMQASGTIRALQRLSSDGSLVYHPILALHENPIAAGQCYFNQGKILRLTEESGHYKPKNRIQYVEWELRQRNAIFTEDYTLLTHTECSLP